jgi:hypothetical protein
MFKTAPL